MGDERRINQLTTKAYGNIGSSDYFAVDNASEAESKKLPASSIKTPISNLQGEVTGGSDTYSSTKNYSVGMYVTHTTSGVQKLYRCKTACTAASWTTNASCFEEANLADAVSQLNNDLMPTLVAVGTNNTSFASQLAELETVFDSLADNRKARAYIKDANVIYKLDTMLGWFSRATCSSSNMTITRLNLEDHIREQWTSTGSTWTYANHSSMVGNSLELYA